MKRDIFIAIVAVVLLLSSLLLLKTYLPKVERKEAKTEKLAKAKLAIVIDDWGYNLEAVSVLKKINAPITLSILPHLKYSRQISKIAKDLGQEVILHLPLEPETNDREYIGLEEYTITTKMSEEEVISNVKMGISSLPNACGVSNHMGSCATKDRRLMQTIFRELKKKDLFFLDNLVTSQSVCSEMAKKIKVKFVSRNFFLDNENNYEYIKEQLSKLAQFALENDFAVGIGHARKTTLEVLKDQIPLLQAKGIKFVFVSDLSE